MFISITIFGCARSMKTTTFEIFSPYCIINDTVTDSSFAGAQDYYCSDKKAAVRPCLT